MKKSIISLSIFVLLIVMVWTLFPNVYAQTSDYFMSLFVRNRLVMSPDGNTSTQSAEIYFEAGTPDQAEYIYGSVDGQLDLVAGTEVQIATTTLDINAAADVADSLTVGASGTPVWKMIKSGTTLLVITGADTFVVDSVRAK